MNIAITDLLRAVSTALDYVEAQVVGVTTYHGQRIAYLSALTGKVFGLKGDELVYLMAAALLHDNALYEFFEGKEDVSANNWVEKELTEHCSKGEENVKGLPFYPQIEHAILYHHERADGKGLFGKTSDEIPLFAKLIHISDTLDIEFNLSEMSEEKYHKLIQYLEEQRDSCFDGECIDAFTRVISYDVLACITGDNIKTALDEIIPRQEWDMTGDELMKFSDIFARITDIKSEFTYEHSLGIARKAYAMAGYYNWGEDIAGQLYFTGALHDIGKLMIRSDILEKPGKLTKEEFTEIQNHAMGTFQILSNVKGLEEITRWASLHHEKLDGSGYPFGLTASELGHKERLLACLDIYQALVEKRPYKNGMPHAKAMEILEEMVDKGQLDGDITADINNYFGGIQIAPNSSV
ncbi:MAG: HD domain-containing protein [Lachnospiraceae bacterium]|nr:HD domain-containing protein [Lachnospiraceae bacterium]